MMVSRSLGSHQRPHCGKSDDWLTPPEIIEAVGPFDLDPCASDHQPWQTAAKHYTASVDGLVQPWEGMVWLNPPFGPAAALWLERLANHGEGVALVPARTETRWFNRWVWGEASAVLFLIGRPHFHYPVSGERAPFNSGAPICLVGYGQEARLRLVSLPLKGVCIDGWFQ